MAAIALVAMVICCAAVQTRPPRFFPYYGSQKLWGYIDTTGRTVIAAQFVRAGRFGEGLAFAVLSDRSCGYINESGQMVIGPTHEWDHGEPFCDGKAVVWSSDLSRYSAPAGGGDRIRSGPAQYIDASGRYITDRWYEGCGNFSDGVGCAYDSTGTTCFDRSGKVLFHTRGWVSDFSEGRAAVHFYDRTADSSQNWYVDRKGRVVIAPRPGLINSPFREGLAFVYIVSDTPVGHERFGYIDRHGQLAFSTTYAPGSYGLYHSYFSEGMVPLKIDTLFGYVDHTGRPVIQPKWRLAWPFSEGLAPAAVDSAGDTRWGYIDRAGRWVIQPHFTHADEFGDGLASIELRGHAFGYVNQQGQLLGLYRSP